MQWSTSEDEISKAEQESNIIQQIMSIPSRTAKNTLYQRMGAARAQSPMKDAKSQSPERVPRAHSQRCVRDDSLPVMSGALDETSGYVPSANTNNSRFRQIGLAGTYSQQYRRDDSLPGRSIAPREDYGRSPSRNANTTQHRHVWTAESQSQWDMRDGSRPIALDLTSGYVPNRGANNAQPRHVLVARSQSQRNVTSASNRSADNTQHRHMNLARGHSQRNARDGSVPGIYVALSEDHEPPRPKTMFGPYGMLDRPSTGDEARSMHVKEKTGLKKWADKIKGTAGELKADLKSMASEIKDVAGELVSGVPSQGDRSIDGYTSAQLTTSLSGPNVRSTHASNRSNWQTAGIIGFPMTDPPPRPASPTKRPLPKISLAPPIQARLFSELELVLTKTINDYLLGEKIMGRMSEASIEKVVKSWMAKGRPLPSEFYFDLATQLELFHANLNTFRFFGQHQGSYLHIQSMLNGWSGLAKNLNRRTLSTPDSDIKKYLVDIDNILVLLGADQKVWEQFGYWKDATLQALLGKEREEEEHGSRLWGVPMASMPPGRRPEEAFDDQNIVETGLRLLGHRNN